MVEKMGNIGVDIVHYPMPYQGLINFLKTV